MRTKTIEQVTHYYPFGTPFSDGSGTGPDVQPYKYNGKEFDAMHGLNTYDYGARQYDPLLITWGKADPVSEMDYSVSMYSYCLNNPITYIDLFGLRAYNVKDAEDNWEDFDPQADEVVLDELYVIGHKRLKTEGLHSGTNSFWDTFSIHTPSKGDGIGAASYAGEHTEDWYSALSTREKSKYTYDAMKFARNKFGLKYKGRNADIYKETIPRFLKEANKILSGSNVLYTVGDNFMDVRTKGKFTIGNGVDLGIMAITTIGPFATMWSAVPVIGLGYLGADIMLEMTTGMGLREHIDKEFGNQGFSIDF